MLMRSALLIAVQTAAMIRNGSVLRVLESTMECSAILWVALRIYPQESTQSLQPGSGSTKETLILTIAATIGCSALNEALKYLFSNPANEYK